MYNSLVLVVLVGFKGERSIGSVLGKLLVERLTAPIEYDDVSEMESPGE